MSDRDRDLREELERRLAASGTKLSTSGFGRLARMGMTALRTSRLLGRKRDDAPDLDALAAIVSSLGQLKGIAMKVGQIMSYVDLALPPQLKAALSVLQTHSQPISFELVRELVQVELGARAGEVLDRMEPIPVAAASIGQVHRTWLPDGTEAAVKIRYPEIDKAIAADFRPAAIGTRFASLLYPGADIGPLIREAHARFLEECDYSNEARAQKRFAALYEGHPTLVVPAVHDAYCSGRVLTTGWMRGARFDDFMAAGPPAADRDRVGAALFEFYIGTLYRHGLYNCDPHPGNYLFLPDGRVAMLDYGCTRAFDRDFVRRLSALTQAVQADDRPALHRAFDAFGMVRKGFDFDDARDLIRSFYGPMLKDEVGSMSADDTQPLSQLFQSKRRLMKLTLPAEFLFLFRIRFGLMSILGRLGTRANWYRLERQLAESAI